MTMTTRPATPSDAPAMCAILNEIIAIGGTTAYEDPFDPATMTANYIAAPLLVHCTLAESDGAPAGFQALWRADTTRTDPVALPPGWAAIASFVKVGLTGQGIGRSLFAATTAAARAAGITTIDATIRADNRSGLTFYSALGFRDYAAIPAVPLRNGTPVDRIRKRFDLPRET
jgi:L-amino acid N-acyltransferase YncA